MEEVSGGFCLPDDTGGNTWVKGGNKEHSYLKLLEDQESMAIIIEDFMLGKF